MSLDSKGLGTSNVARKTRLDNEAELIAAPRQAMKSKLLCELGAESISNEDIFRLKVREDSLGFPNTRVPYEIMSPDDCNVFATDKQRMLRLINKHAGVCKH